MNDLNAGFIKNKLKVFAIVPSAFCFGLQHITIDFFGSFTDVESLFLVTGWNNGDFINLLNRHELKHKIGWFGMFSRKMDWHNVKMSLQALIKLPGLYYGFYKTLKQFKPDILYFANHHELILLYPVLKCVKSPVVCHMHDPAPAIPFQKKTFSFYSAVVDRFIAISDNVKQRTIDLGCDPRKIDTLHNGIKLPVDPVTKREDVFIKRFSWDKDVFIVGITGQMTETKGHMDLLQAFKIAYSQNPNLRLVIGGKSMAPLYEQLQQQIAEWNLERVVCFSGWVSAVNIFFKNIDLFVLASRHDEGYGLVVAEAMAHQLPVVITNSGGAVEIVRNGENGYIVPKRDTKAMAEKLLHLSLNPEFGKQMGGNGEQIIRSKFNLKVQAGLLQQAFFKIKHDAIRN